MILWSIFALVKTNAGITTSQPHPDQQPMELPKTQFAGLKKVPPHFWFRRVFQKSGVETQWNASLIWETHKTSGQTESHSIKED